MTMKTFPIRCMLEAELAALPDELRGLGNILDVIEPIVAVLRTCQATIQDSAPFLETPLGEQAEITAVVGQMEKVISSIELSRATTVAAFAAHVPLATAQIDALIEEMRAALDAAHAYIGSVRTTATPPRADSSPAAPLPFLPKERK